MSDYDAFDSRYHVAANAIPVAGVYSGTLSNNGDAIKLFQVGEADPQSGYVPYYRVDYINFEDHAPWPEEPDGTGSPLIRRDVDQYGNDPINWIAGGWRGTPGQANTAIDKSAPSTPANLTGHVTVNPDKITLQWAAAVDNESYVDHYVVYRDGSVLGTATTTSYADVAVVPRRPYSYAVSPVNRDGYEGMRSATAVVTVPGITNYALPDASHIEIDFTEALTPESATLLGNYVLTDTTLRSAALSANGRKVTLSTTQPLVIDNSYSLTIKNLATVSGNELPDNLGIAFTYVPQGDGYILREYWSGIGGTRVSDLTGHPDYPNNATGRTYATSFEGPVDWNDDYGTRMRGYVHPPKSGEYVFWIASDDSSELWLSTDEDPAHKVQIAGVPEWTSSREWTRFSSQQSAPIRLMTGRKYYIEALAKEGGGGDNLAVRWQLPGGEWENPADPGAPIPGIRLSQWGPPPDTSAPTVPVGLSAQIVNGTRVDLSWAAATDLESGVHHYVVYRDGQEYARSTTANYSDTGATPGTRHRYQVSATNPFDFASEHSATISVAPAGVVSAAALNATTVQLVFTEPMDRTRAEQTANYAISAGRTVTAAVLQADRLTVRLTTSSLTLSTTYTVTVNNLRTASGVALPENHQATLYYGNGILWEYWLNVGGGNAVADLTNNPSYPFNPSGREYRSLFEAPTNWADAYGGRMRGYITPATTGNYWFWIASDDNGELWLSTDSNPDNKTRIASVPGWTNSREWTRYAEQKSASIYLVAGNRYYVEALMKEGGGGDDLAVGWQRDGTAFDGLPIPGDFLTPYTETITTLLVTPSVQTLLTNDTTPLLGGSVNDPNVALTVALAGRYYAATRNTNTTWLLPDGVIEPALTNGTYDVVACATDAASRTAFDTTTNELVVDTTSPTADILDVTPDPRETTVGVVTITFTEDVVGVDTSDFRLTRNGGEVDLGGLSVTRVNGRRYTINLSSVTVAHGAYVLTLIAEGSGIRDLAGNALTVAASDAWRRGAINNPPTLDGIPDPDPIDEDAGQQTILLTGISAGTGEDQPLAITAQSDTPGLIDVVHIAYGAGATTAALSFTPVSDAWGSAHYRHGGRRRAGRIAVDTRRQRSGIAWFRGHREFRERRADCGGRHVHRNGKHRTHCRCPGRSPER